MKLSSRVLFFVGILSVYSLVAKSEKLSLPAFAVQFQVDKNLPIKRAILGIRCIREASFWERLNNGLDEHAICDDFTLNGVNPGYNDPTVNLQKVGENRFALAQDIEVKFSNYRNGHVCLFLQAEIAWELKATFMYPWDKYSLLSFCTVDELPLDLNKNVYNNRRVPSLQKFYQTLGQGIPLRLK